MGNTEYNLVEDLFAPVIVYVNNKFTYNSNYLVYDDIRDMYDIEVLSVDWKNINEQGDNTLSYHFQTEILQGIFKETGTFEFDVYYLET